MLAFALRADGWWLRSEVIWSKPNPMPESVRDRPTKTHEQLFLLTKSPRYWYDAEAIKGDEWRTGGGANARSVWSIATQPYPDAHYATFPEELPRRCILSGCPERVCRECGDPSSRIVERVRRGDWNPRSTTDKAVSRSTNGSGGSRFYDLPQHQTVGWTDCGHNAWRAGVVLDPFAGTGTTLQVARHHSRHAIGIEGNPDDLPRIARRLQQLSLTAMS